MSSHGIHNPPAWLTAKQRLLVSEAYLRALAALRRQKAPRAYEALFTEIFEQRCGLKERVVETRGYLREVMGVSSDRTVTRGLTWLWRRGFMWRAADATKRKLGTLMVEKKYLPWGGDFWTDRPAPPQRTRTQVSHSTLYRTPSVPLAPSEKVPYSAPRHTESSAPQRTAKTATATAATTPRRTGTRRTDPNPVRAGRVADGRDVARGILQQLLAAAPRTRGKDPPG